MSANLTRQSKSFIGGKVLRLFVYGESQGMGLFPNLQIFVVPHYFYPPRERIPRFKLRAKS